MRTSRSRILRHLAGFAAFGKGFRARRICENAGVAGIMAQTPMKLKRGTFAATFFLACLAAMEIEGVVLDEI
ncbi:MAG TPA: DUF6471 domain-containing protein [Bradyrhizobium sp.]|jgi:hypothetical protein|uniref:DUF6471 domain-containing protein n=1 Tax=Bradyrhizobium sp. TaxID=376 RepID=UPI002C708C68|nr:DUF6471 domain-containing protein [Bradyrhizobium sp.]HTB03808.1 DUF6471 domain-containing protein [Bradyrhizobium sp.]